MPMLPLAVDIADTLAATAPPFDADVKAKELLEAHPEAEASRADIRDILEEEAGALGEEPAEPIADA